MEKQLKNLFDSLKTEYFAVLDYADCIVCSENIIGREDFKPRSVIVYLVPYYTGETDNISRYSASLDYHIAIREINSKIAKYLSAEYKNAKFKGYGDHSPIAERHAALIGGLGVLGDNGLLINEKYGSYIFIGDVITDIPSEILGAQAPKPIIRCEGCGLCKKACPTGILRKEGNECLSAITQKKGELTEEEMSLMRKYNTAWGCDECQSYCPHNKNSEKTPLEFFYRDRIEKLSREILDKMSRAEFEERAFSWRGRKTIERNIGILEE